MRRGKVFEKNVIAVLKSKLDLNLEDAGLLLISRYPVLGASQDAISEDYIIEIKWSSTTKTVTNYINSQNEIANKYIAQMLILKTK